MQDRKRTKNNKNQMNMNNHPLNLSRCKIRTLKPNKANSSRFNSKKENNQGISREVSKKKDNILKNLRTSFAVMIWMRRSKWRLNRNLKL